MRTALLCKAGAAALLLAGTAAPAYAVRGPVLVKAGSANPIILAKDRSEKDSTADGKAQSVCKPAIKPMTEGRVSRNENCPKPKPILM